MSSYPPLDVTTEVRPHFPAIDGSFVFADNAGGSQILQQSIDSISSYLIHSNVQLGGGYSHSIKAGKFMKDAVDATALLVNAGPGGANGVVHGSSSTQLATNLGYAMELAGMDNSTGLFQSGDEFIFSGADHEANVGPWSRLAVSLKLNTKYWLPTPTNPSSPFSLGLDPSVLSTLVTPKTRIVAFCATSNILGQFTNVKEAVSIIKEKSEGRAIVVVDCVAYAPHGRIDMVDWGCDVVIFSYYKLFGPHLSAMVISSQSPLRTLDIPSLGHYFHPKDPASYKFAPGGAPYELQVGCAAVIPYLLSLGTLSSNHPNTTPHDLLDIAFSRIRAHEALLSARLLEYLLSEEAKKKGVRVVGPETAEGRAPTISFVVLGEESDGLWKKRITSAEVVKHFDENTNMGIKYGDFYAKRIMQLLPLSDNACEFIDPTTATIISEPGKKWNPLPEADAVIRISLAHYTTLDEVDSIVEELKKVI